MTGDIMSIYTPGSKITTDPAYMRGHGTFVDENGSMYASVAGPLNRTNKLLTVIPLHSRYMGDIGDVIIGIITEIGSKRWRVDLNSRQQGVLLLSSIHLPGAIQRRKSENDELLMRTFFREGEIICAEVQQLFQDGAIGIHTRNLEKYGKLITGTIAQVQQELVTRMKSHFIEVDGIEIILGMNGMIWIGKPRKPIKDLQDLDEIYSDSLDSDLNDKDYDKIIKIRRIILKFDNGFMPINEQNITKEYYSS